MFLQVLINALFDFGLVFLGLWVNTFIIYVKAIFFLKQLFQLGNIDLVGVGETGSEQNLGLEAAFGLHVTKQCIEKFRPESIQAFYPKVNGQAQSLKGSLWYNLILAGFLVFIDFGATAAQFHIIGIAMSGQHNLGNLPTHTVFRRYFAKFRLLKVN